MSRAPGSIRGVRAGVRLLPEGFALLRQERSLWALASVPVGLAIIAVGTVGTLFALQVEEIHTVFRAALPTLTADAWWTWLWVGPGKAILFLLGWLAVALSFAVSLVGGLLIANLVSAPFLDVLSQRVEEIVTGRPAVDMGGQEGIAMSALRSFAAELQRLAFLFVIWISLTMLGFVIPGAHFVTGPLLIALTVLFLPLDYAGYALDRRLVGFGDRRRWLREHLSIMVGFGGVAFASCLVPGLNLVVLPSLVTGGTLLVLRARPEALRSGPADFD